MNLAVKFTSAISKVGTLVSLSRENYENTENISFYASLQHKSISNETTGTSGGRLDEKCSILFSPIEPKILFGNNLAYLGTSYCVIHTEYISYAGHEIYQKSLLRKEFAFE